MARTAREFMQMSSIDGGLWAWLKPIRQHYKRALHICRVENSAGSGMPDVEGQLKDYGQFWLELKACAWPARKTTQIRPKIRPAQVEWISRRAKAGGNVWLLVQVGTGKTRERFLIHGAYVEELDTGVTEPRLRQMSYAVKDRLSVFRVMFSL